MSDSAKTILVVDDETNICQSIADYFEDNLWRIFQAKSGEEALELMKKKSPDGVVVDIRMRGMDGNAFIREAHRQKSGAVFVVCTGSPEYVIPNDLKEIPFVSKHVFRKPVTDMSAIENELLRLISVVNNNQ